MKFVIVLGDGMADRPCEQNGFVTALCAVDAPTARYMAQNGVVGKVQTVPENMQPGSDVANLSVLGYNPKECYTGRSPIEALSMGIPFAADDLTLRTNLVHVDGALCDENTTMFSHSAGDVTTSEARQLIDAVAEEINDDNTKLYAGVSYRHCLILKGADTGATLTPPHDIIGRQIAPFLPAGKNADKLMDIMLRAEKVLKNHPVNTDRARRGLPTANSVWFWGEGKKPTLDNFYEKYGLRAAIISAVDLLKGIGVGGGMSVIDVPGATGNAETDYAAKGRAAIEALKTHDFVFVHVEAPDECAHGGDNAGKIQAIRDIDQKILAPLYKKAKESKGELSVMFLPDHATPVALRTHTSEPVPFVIWNGNLSPNGANGFNEVEAEKTGLFLESGEKLLDYFLQR